MDGTPISGSAASLRPQGIMRYVGALFLAVWLTGWAIGEAFALGMLGGIFGSLSGAIRQQQLPAYFDQWATSGAVAFVILFLLVWLTLWTFGGIAAMTHLLRMIAGEDRLTLQGSGFELVRRAGPFCRTRVFDRTSVRRVRLRPHDKALVADTAGGTEVLTQFGDVGEREAIGEWLRQRLSLSDHDSRGGARPAHWEVTSTDGAGLRLRRHGQGTRRTQALVAWLVAGAVCIGWFASLGEGGGLGSVPALVLTLVLGLGAMLVTLGHREWVVRPGQLTFRRRFLTYETERTFASARLDVTQSTDSDNDAHYRLEVRDERGSRTVYRELNDSGETIDFARWLASRTGFPLTLPHGMEPPRTSRISDDEWRSSR